MLHRVVTGLGGQGQPQAVLMDTIVSVVVRDGDSSPPSTLLCSSRVALQEPGTEMNAANREFRVISTTPGV